jgi:cell wall-associated NlpC family hydrolase
VRQRAVGPILALVCSAALLGPLDTARGQDVAAGTGSAELALSAIGLVGVPYRYGGSDPDTGLDCSGLVHYVVRNVLGVQLPRQSEAMSRTGVPVPRQALQPGDLVFFNTLGRPFSHVGVYLGDDQFVHAPTRRGRVRVEAMVLPYWARRYSGARRLDGIASEAAPDAQPTTPPRARPEMDDDPFGLNKP